MRLRGYRGDDLPLLSGPWLPGELLGLPAPGRPALAPEARFAPPADTSVDLCVAPEAGCVRYTELDWVNRRARLEIGVRPDATDSAAELLHAALVHGFRTLNLHRVYGWVTPHTGDRTGLLERAGLRLEAELPQALWLDGRPATRQIWGRVHHG
ncbi:GNAT family protein [Streptantibioticus parmotrematis]|uniref:GNAT family N-acetyltransferase n=1 Tax=Streptantibioticus parmotrematis TaxID=2873249 RepID=UPI0033FABAA2